MTQTLELSEIQATALRHRPTPYYGAYVFMRINDPEHTPTLLSRLIPKITTSAEWQKPVDESWLNIVFTYTGLARPRLPQAILDGFPQEFRVPMSERKQYLGDIGESDPANWDCPFGRSELHTEFLQSQWVNDGDFVSAGHDKAPIEGDHPKDSQFMFSAAPGAPTASSVADLCCDQGWRACLPAWHRRLALARGGTLVMCPWLQR